MEPLDAAFQKFEALGGEVARLEQSILSEADVRLKVVDPMLTSILGWDKSDILTEESAGTGFIDYKLSVSARARMVVEAKKDSRDLGVSADKSGRFYKLDGPVFSSKHVKEGIEQGIRYAAHKNAELAVVTNGRQWVVFRANRLGDGKDTLAGYACVFSGWSGLKEHFAKFYDLLSCDGVAHFTFRAHFQQAEGEPIQSTSFNKPVCNPLNRRLLPCDPISNDIDKVMAEFFRTLTEPAMRRACFVTSPESDQAESRLSRISEDLLNKLQTLDTDEGEKLAETIRRVDETQNHAFGLLVGTKGAGKSTFVERFFEDVLPKDLAGKCVVLRVDLADSEGDEKRVTDWLNNRLLEQTESAVFPGKPATYDQLQGMYFDVYKRWSEGPHLHLYNADKTAFKQKFGDYLEELRTKEPLDYIVRMLNRVVRSEKKIPCLVFDNGDHFTIDFQERVFQYAKSVSNRVICMTLLPITDKTSWQLSRQGALQSFYTESFYLPTPSPQSVLLKRIQFIEKLLESEKPEKGTGYSFGASATLNIENLKAFVNCLQAVFVQSGDVATWIGNLSNQDIRRCLKLVRDTITSPHIAVHELLQAYVAKSTVDIDKEATKRAIVHGQYDIYPAGQHEYVQNLYSLHTEIVTSPLIGLRILTLLGDTQHQEPDGDARFILVDHVIAYLLQLGFEVNVTRQWLDALLKCGLCLSYDPTITALTDTTRVEMSPSGRQHLQWATYDWGYFEAMLRVTPLRDKSAHSQLIGLIDINTAAARRDAMKAFLEYMLAEDTRVCVVPDHESFKSQSLLTETLKKECEKLSRPLPISESRRYGTHTGSIVKWDDEKGFGFASIQGVPHDVFVHISEVNGTCPLTYGDPIECDVVEGQGGKPKGINVRKLDR